MLVKPRRCTLAARVLAVVPLGLTSSQRALTPSQLAHRPQALVREVLHPLS